MSHLWGAVQPCHRNNADVRALSYPDPRRRSPNRRQHGQHRAGCQPPRRLCSDVWQVIKLISATEHRSACRISLATIRTADEGSDRIADRVATFVIIISTITDHTCQRALAMSLQREVILSTSVVGTKLPIRDVRSSVSTRGTTDVVRKARFGSD